MLRAVALLSTALLLSQCTVAPKQVDKPVTYGLPAPKTGTLAQTAAKLAAQRSSHESSFLLLEGNKEALDWRLALMDEAKSSIDIQLYLWHSGSASRLLIDRALAAAERGVRVRILVDDFLMSADVKMDQTIIAAVCRHQPNFNIRIFNPNRVRGDVLTSSAGFLMNFRQLNRRMHNKTWTVDRTFSIIGGRNVADQYFGLSEKYNFLDFDVLVAGPVINDVADGFDEFWNSSLAYPANGICKHGTPNHIQVMHDEIRQKIDAEADGRLSSFPTKRRSWSREFARLPAQMAQGRAVFLQDHPEPDDDERHLVQNISDMTLSQKGEVILVTPYLIPTDRLLEHIEIGKKSGIEVAFLAPSLGAINHPVAYAHYSKKRKPIIEAGARLFEMDHHGTEELRSVVDVHPVRGEEVALHAKAVVGDRKRCFIGSLNLDPRALRINTESGILIDSASISNELMALLENIAWKDAWEVTLDEKNKLLWHRPGVWRTSAPPAKFSKRMSAFLTRWLPIESQL